ncbi:MAG: glycoside hydrolase family 25 protein [Chloroflexi bacterium]|nr:glycoside hydrolase family 25 protein [Chloroflexota bacterium]
MNFNYTGIEGFDVSTYQDNPTTPAVIDFEKMKAWGADFVIIRAGQNVWIDQDFYVNWQNAGRAGLPRGAYWFYDPRVSPQRQAKLFTDLFKNDPPEGRLWIDLEYPASWGGMYTHWTEWRTMIEETKRLSGLPVGIYTADWWWHEQVIGDYAYFGKYPLWVAGYTSDPANVALPKGWTKALIWQDGTPTIGHDAGVESVEIDHNKFNGDVADFFREFGNVPPPIVTPPPTTGENNMLSCKTLVQVKVFNSTAANAAQVRLIGAGVTFNALSQTGDWLMISTNEWVNVMKNGTLAVQVTAVAPPPPPTKRLTNLIHVYNDGSIDVLPQ